MTLPPSQKAADEPPTELKDFEDFYAEVIKDPARVRAIIEAQFNRLEAEWDALVDSKPEGSA
jgi:hypothetical protein